MLVSLFVCLFVRSFFARHRHGLTPSQRDNRKLMFSASVVLPLFLNFSDVFCTDIRKYSHGKIQMPQT